MKKVLLVSMLMVLLVGCKVQETEKEYEDKRELVVPTIDASQREDIESMVPDNEEGTLYFTCKNANEDIYLKSTERPYYEFYILSLEPLDKRDIKVKIPIQTKYATVVKEISSEDLRTTEYLLNKDQPVGTHISSNIAYPYYLYQCSRGTDWKLMTELSSHAEGAEKQLMDLMLGSAEEPEFLEAKKKVGAYVAYRDLYLKDYESLKPEDIPEFYVYNVAIWFGYTKAYAKNIDVVKLGDESIFTESFQTIDIKIGNETYAENIGEIRLIAESLSDVMDEGLNRLYWEDSFVGQIDEMGIEYPWGNGSAYIAAFQAIPQQDITLTGIHIEHENVTLLGATIIQRHKFQYTNTGQVVNVNGDVIPWDGKSELEIKKGTIMYMYLIIYDPDMTWLNYGKRIYPALEYRTISAVTGKEKDYCNVKEIILDRDNTLQSIWVRYAAVFEDLGYRLQDYFNYCYEKESDYYIWKQWKTELRDFFDARYEEMIKDQAR